MRRNSRRAIRRAIRRNYSDGPLARLQADFEKKFGISWADALAQGKVYNAVDGCKKLGIDGSKMDKLWAGAKKGGNLVKFGGGFYAGKIPAPAEVKCAVGPAIPNRPPAAHHHHPHFLLLCLRFPRARLTGTAPSRAQEPKGWVATAVVALYAMLAKFEGAAK